MTFVKEYAFDANSEIYVVETAEHRLIAQIWLHTTRNRFNGMDELWIWDITVHEQYRQHGIGTRLMEFATNRAETLNCAELWLLVSSKNDKAVRIYESVGMSAAGFLMRRDLGPRQEANNPPHHEFHTAGLRQLKPADIDQLWKLWEIAGLPFRPNGRDSKDKLTRHLSGTSIGGWGLFSDSSLLAACLVSTDGRKGYIERLATHPDHRRRGFAAQIIVAARQALRESGALVISALIEKDNIASRSAFESAGFIHSPNLCYYSFREKSDT
jgi:ribosomal protein S18 acetylase RimI-like enzyme